MDKRAYTDFTITLRTAGAEYEAEVSVGDRTATNTFTLPFAERELQDFFSMFGGPRTRRIESPQLERTRAFGDRLYKAVFSDELEELLTTSLSDTGPNRGLRIRLDLDQAPDLINVPWEYMHRQAGDDFLVLSNWTPIVRRLEVATRLQTAPMEPPLRILVMISEPDGYRQVDSATEWQQVEEKLADLTADGRVVIDRLEAATESALRSALRRKDYHIFHFIGHGDFDPEHQDGVLVLEDERRRADLVTGRDIGRLLYDARTIRLVVLNNCEGGTSSDTDLFAGAAQSLIQKGIPAVAAMQFEITDHAAIAFAKEFYAGLADGYPADAALGEARKAIYRGATQHEFGSPVLYLSADDGVIFDITEGPATTSETTAAPVLPGPAESASPIDTPPASEPAPFAAAAPVSPTAETQQLPPAAAPPPAAPPEAPTREMKPVDPPAGSRKVLYGLVGAVVVLLVLIGAAMFIPDDDAPVTTIPQEAITTAVTETTVPTTTNSVTTTPPTTTTAGAVVGAVEPEFADPPSIADFTSTPPNIDGFDGEWTSRFFYESAHAVFGAGTITDDVDLYADWQLAWDDKFLYLYAVVDDDLIAQVNTGPSLFKGDAVAFYFDADLSDDAPDAQLSDDDVAFFFAPQEDGQNWVRLVPSANGGGFASEGAMVFDPELKVATDIREGGYDIEIQVPWRLLGVSDPEAGQSFRMTLDVSDNDTPNESVQEAMKSNSVNRTIEGQAFPASWEKMILEAP